LEALGSIRQSSHGPAAWCLVEIRKVSWVLRHHGLVDFWRLMWLGCQIGAFPCRFTWPP
jgi:hypothetical protein